MITYRVPRSSFFSFFFSFFLRNINLAYENDAVAKSEARSAASLTVRRHYAGNEQLE